MARLIASLVLIAAAACAVTARADADPDANGKIDLSWTSPAAVDLQWSRPNGTTERIPGLRLAPRYGIVTSTADADGRKVATEYANPALGLPTATVVDPAGSVVDGDVPSVGELSGGDVASGRGNRSVGAAGVSRHSASATTSPSAGDGSRSHGPSPRL